MYLIVPRTVTHLKSIKLTDLLFLVFPIIYIYFRRRKYDSIIDCIWNFYHSLVTRLRCLSSGSNKLFLNLNPNSKPNFQNLQIFNKKIDRFGSKGETWDTKVPTVLLSAKQIPDFISHNQYRNKSCDTPVNIVFV